MPIELPVLDDKRYADLMEEARASIPKLYPGWTDHNPADPGITLIELFAWLADILIYRVGRLPDARYQSFLRLLHGPDFKLEAGQTLDDAITTTLGKVRERYRAVSSDDFEYLTKETWPTTDAAATAGTVARVKCFPQRNLGGTEKLANAPAYVSLLIVPTPGAEGVSFDAPSDALISGLQTFFKNRKLITTRLSIVGPSYVVASFSATIYLKDFANPADVRSGITEVLNNYFDPVTGGDDKTGYRFGGEINVARMYALFEGIRGVDYTEDVVVTTPDGESRELKDGDEVLSIALKDYELVRVDEDASTFTLMVRSGDKWKAV